MLKLILAMLLLSGAALTWSSSPDSILGHWVMPDGSALIEVYKVDASYSVRIKALREQTFTVADEGAPLGKSRLDIHNPDEDKRERSLLGLDLAWGLTYDDGVWAGGDIYDPGSGNTYSCELVLAQGGFLKVRGYLGFSLLGRSMYWQRAGDFKMRVNAMLNGLAAE